MKSRFLLVYLGFLFFPAFSLVQVTTPAGQNAIKPVGHWSPNNEWAMNFAIRGFNECLSTYVLAASGERYPIARLLFMSCPEIKSGLLKLGFNSPYLNN